MSYAARKYDQAMTAQRSLFLFLAAITLGGCDSDDLETEEERQADVFVATTFTYANFYSGCLGTFDALAAGGYVDLRLYADNTFQMDWSVGFGRVSSEGQYEYAGDRLLLSVGEGVGPLGDSSEWQVDLPVLRSSGMCGMYVELRQVMEEGE